MQVEALRELVRSDDPVVQYNSAQRLATMVGSSAQCRLQVAAAGGPSNTGRTSHRPI